MAVHVTPNDQNEREREEKEKELEVRTLLKLLTDFSTRTGKIRSWVEIHHLVNNSTGGHYHIQ
jgi:hypothetical protein